MMVWQQLSLPSTRAFCKRSENQAVHWHHLLLLPGWSAALPVAAYVVAVRGAAYPGMSGLLQPLLRRWQAGGCSYTVFALPAVQVQCVVCSTCTSYGALALLGSSPNLVGNVHITSSQAWSTSSI